MLEDSFVPGLDLAEALWRDGVRPVLADRFPELVYSAALIGGGSEVLGFDTPQSMDHDWGPRLLLFLPEEGSAATRAELDRALSLYLPSAILGVATNLAYERRSEDRQGSDASGPPRHPVAFHAVRDYFCRLLNADPTGLLCPADWLAMPEQYLRSLTAGRVFHDGLGLLEPTRARLQYYPHDVWLYLMACQWRRIAQEEPFMGRCGQAGDELGARIVAARLARDIMRVCFLQERTYAPYLKWLGTAFSRLRCAGPLAPVLVDVMDAEDWREREQALSTALEFVARAHNGLAVTPPVPAEASPFYDRPFRVIHGDRFATALLEAVGSAEVRSFPLHLGGVDQFVDSTDVLDDPSRLGRLKAALLA